MSKQRLTIRIFIPWYLPAYKAGGPVQSIANLVAQPMEGAMYKIVTSNKELDGSTINVSPNRWVKQDAQTQVYYAANGIKRKLLGTRDEVLFINGIYSWHYTLFPILFAPARRKVVSVRGMLHPGALSQKAWKKKFYLQLWKAFLLSGKLAFHASTEQEKTYVKQVFGPSALVYVASNFPRVFCRQPVMQKTRGELVLISIALLSPMKNILLVLEALQHTPDRITYQIYGPVKDHSYWQQCLERIRTLPSNITVQVHGDIHPAQVEQALAKGQVFVLPSKSENFGHAIYEALTAGKPVITSHHTPWNNLEKTKAGINISLEGIWEMAGAIKFFAGMGQAELEDWSRGAAAYAANSLDLAAIEEQYRQLFGFSTSGSEAGEAGIEKQKTHGTE